MKPKATRCNAPGQVILHCLCSILGSKKQAQVGFPFLGSTSHWVTLLEGMGLAIGLLLLLGLGLGSAGVRLDFNIRLNQPTFSE